MKTLRCFLIFLCLTTLDIPVYSARRNRPKYLAPSPPVLPLIKTTITQKNKKLTKQVHELKLQTQKELKRQKIDLEKERNQQIINLKNNYEKEIDKIKQKFSQEAQKISTEKEKEWKQIKQKVQQQKKENFIQTKQEALRKVNEAELELLKKHLKIKHKKDLVKKEKPLQFKQWKKTMKKELDVAVACIKPILRDDKELSDMLIKKKASIETKITNTQTINDKNFNDSINELKPLALTHKATEIADGFLEKNFKMMKISKQNRSDIRFIVFSELQPFIKKAVDEGQIISQQTILTLVTQAVSEVLQKPIQNTNTNQTTPKLAKLRKQLRLLEAKLKTEQSN